MKASTDQTGLNRRLNRVESARKRARGAAAAVVMGAAAALAACSPFDVNVATADPIKVDLNMEVHVYQHGKDKEDGETKNAQATYDDAMTRRRNRMEEVQELKNNRLVGETHEGLLSIRNLPAAEYGKYVKETVESENRDRDFLMQYEADEKDEPVTSVRRMKWRHWQRKSFPGEWIEVEGDQPDTYRWTQKEEASG